MDTQSLVKTIFTPHCENCDSDAKFQITEDNFNFYLCNKCYQSYKKYNDVLRTGNIEEIKLPVGGLFKTSSVVSTHSKLSFENWRDFGLKRREFKKKQAELKIGLAPIIYQAIDDTGNEKLITYHSLGEKFECLEVDIHEWMIQKYCKVYLKVYSKEIIFVDFGNEKIFF